MLILGLESSCDETAAALVENGVVLASVVRSQIDLHKQYGGVVPEIASRAHLEAVDVISREALAEAGRTLADLDGLAVTQGPGLVGALLVALSFAKGLSLSAKLPLTGVNHVKAHALAPFLSKAGDEKKPEPPFPLVALVVSGGHTNLYRLNDYLNFTHLGRTRDDAAGEAFDKTAKLMGLGYPGGRVIEEMAAEGDPEIFRLARPMLKEGLDFSFSGLKTQVLTIYQGEKMAALSRDDQKLRDLAAGFQAAVVEVLVTKLTRACEEAKAKGAILAGGVAANGALRRAAEKALKRKGLALHVPPLAWCADNAAMIAGLGERQLEAGENLLDLSAEAYPRWPVA
ncbi:tRNA (adenosine(37)-N6)-threonylcarbamoyltransferase complex transferase subunit TsaD [Deltaproteobacteria bacterium OttesenSCG-928-K17]|nr:tRNA (adenosine(37)-N6)-threonylcarbamoyltransferase complex transferase subunit TsaD [Deltaproteobacteria bacterium OttesenSCG-928-K17]